MASASPFLASLAPYLPYIAVALAVAAVAIIAFTVYYSKRTGAPAAPKPAPAPKRGAPPPPAAPPPMTPPQTSRERRQTMLDMQHATHRLTGLDLVHDHPYSIPWFVLLGASDANPHRLTDILEPADPTAPAQDNITAQGYRIAFAKEGAIVEVDPIQLAAPDWSERWEKLLWFLRGARPLRPADGIVIAIPVEWLTGPNALPADRLADRGTQFYESIWQFQRQTGMRVPVYLVLTGAEKLRGFTSLAQIAPFDVREEMLGWATPDVDIDDFDPQKVGRAVEQLVAGLSSFQLQLFGGSEIPPTLRTRRQSAVSELFLLPADIHGLGEPLRLFLTAMLRSSVYHEPFMFRGFFLTGAGGTAREPGGEIFARGLFHRKIFREFQMARPAKGFITARNRRVRIAQACLAASVLLGIAGLIAVDRKSEEYRAALEPAIDFLDVQTGGTGLAPSAGNEPVRHRVALSPKAQIAAVDLLLDKYNNLPRTTESWLTPLSHWEDSDRRVSDALAVGYRLFVFDAIKAGLEEKSREIFADIAPSSPATCGMPNNGASATRTVTADDFQNAVATVETLNRNIQTYNQLDVTHRVADLKDLATYALGIHVSEDFTENSELYSAALKEAHANDVDSQAIRQKLHTALLNGFMAAVAHQYDAGLAADALHTARALANDVDDADVTGQSAIDLLRKLHADLRTIDAAAGGGGGSWNGGLGPQFDKLLERLRSDRLDIVPPDVVAELESKGQECRRAAQLQLVDLTGLGAGVILENRGGKLGLSAGYKALSDALERLFAEDFMNNEDTSDPADAAFGNERIAWNIPLVNSAQQALERYSAIEQGPLLAAPPEIVRVVKVLAQVRLATFIRQRVAAARRVQGDQIATTARLAEIRNFSAVSPMLLTLASGLNRIDQTDKASWILQQGTVQAKRLLLEVSDGLRRTSLYSPVDPDFSWWNGTPKFAAQSFGVTNAGELAAWIGTQRNNLAAIATDEAQPLESYLNGVRNLGASVTTTPQENEAAALWSGILDALDRKSPGGSLAVLENFILSGMDQIELSNCRDATAATSAGSDYFGRRLALLKDGIANRCKDLQRTQLRQVYGQVAGLFSTSLAGHFPFVREYDGSKTFNKDSDGNRQSGWADPDDVRRLYRLLDQAGAAPDWKSAFGASSPQAAFIAQLEALRPALAPLVADATQEQPPAWGADIDFRADRNLEVAGNQVIELSLEGKGVHVSSLQDKTTLTWSFGQSFQLVLRWAENAPSIPAPKGSGRPQVRDVSASWNYDNPWALFALLLDTGPGRQGPLPPAAQPGTIVLTVPLAKNPQAAQGGEPALGQATLYVRLRLQAIEHAPGLPDKRTYVTLPKFPFAAP